MLNGNPFRHRPVRLAWFERDDTPAHRFAKAIRADRQQPAGTRRMHARMTNNHRRFPMGTRISVWVQDTDRGFCPCGCGGTWGEQHSGKVVKHDRDYCDGRCLIEFAEPVNLGTAQGEHRYHVVPFARLRRLPTPEVELS